MARFREGTETSLVVALGSTLVFMLLAGVVALLVWIAFSIYAIVEIVGDGRPSATAVLVLVVGLVGALTTLAGVGIWLIGRGLAPPKRSRD